MIQGDISKCFDKIPHKIVIELLRKKIVDPRFLEIIKKFLENGVQEARTKEIPKTTLGIPQGGIISPILCNIVLDLFDKYMEEQIARYNQGIRRGHNREYPKLEYQRIKSKSMCERRKLLTEMSKVFFSKIQTLKQPNSGQFLKPPNQAVRVKREEPDKG